MKRRSCLRVVSVTSSQLIDVSSSCRGVMLSVSSGPKISEKQHRLSILCNQL